MVARERISGQRVGLLATAFLMIVLIGVFATYAAPIPGIRAVLVETSIAQAAASGDAGAMRAALVATKPLLGVSGQRALAGLAPDRAGMSAAAVLLRADGQAASVLVSYRLRLMVIVIGVLAGLFGIAILGIRDGRGTPTIMRVNNS